MLIKKKDSSSLPYSEVTPKEIAFNRRKFLTGAAAAGVGALAGGAFYRMSGPEESVEAGAKLNFTHNAQFSTTEKQNSYKDVTTYNNFYEFGTGKSDPSQYAKDFKSSPWTVSVEGLCKKPKKYEVQEIIKLAALEERVYRHRCVEGWSIVVISFVADEPTTTWNKAAPQEYGFYSNVNPTVDHPRWSQATERRLGEFFRRKTLLFNGYADQVGSMYSGMDLRKNY